MCRLRRDVTLRRVVHYHAVGVETPAQGADGALHALDPASGQTVVVALVVERDHFIAEGALEGFRVLGIVDRHVGVGAPHSDGETILAIISLGPPAIED